jgi:hypothetical protein
MATNLIIVEIKYFVCNPILFPICMSTVRPPLWSIGQSSWLQIQRSQVRFPALPYFLKSSGSGTRFTQPREDN